MSSIERSPTPRGGVENGPRGLRSHRLGETANGRRLKVGAREEGSGGGREEGGAVWKEGGAAREEGGAIRNEEGEGRGSRGETRGAEWMPMEDGVVASAGPHLWVPSPKGYTQARLCLPSHGSSFLSSAPF